MMTSAASRERQRTLWRPAMGAQIDHRRSLYLGHHTRKPEGRSRRSRSPSGGSTFSTRAPLSASSIPHSVAGDAATTDLERDETVATGGHRPGSRAERKVLDERGQLGRLVALHRGGGRAGRPRRRAPCLSLAGTCSACASGTWNESPPRTSIGRAARRVDVGPQRAEVERRIAGCRRRSYLQVHRPSARRYELWRAPTS